MRSVLSYDVCVHMDLLKLGVQDASDRAIERLATLGSGAEAGLIALTSKGEVGIGISTAGMYRGLVTEDGIRKTAVWKEDWETYEERN